MKTPRILSHCIGRIHDWSIRLFTPSQAEIAIRFSQQYRYDRRSSRPISVLFFPLQQGKLVPVPVRIDTRRRR